MRGQTSHHAAAVDRDSMHTMRHPQDIFSFIRTRLQKGFGVRPGAPTRAVYFRGGHWPNIQAEDSGREHIPGCEQGKNTSRNGRAWRG